MSRHHRRGAPPSVTSRVWASIPARAVRVRREIPLAVLDAALVVLCNAAFLLLRYEGGVPPDAWDGFRAYAPVAVLVVLSAQAVGGLYGRVWRYASVREARRILQCGFVAGAILVAVLLIGPRLVPLTVATAGCVFATMVIGLTRFQARLFAYQRGDRDDQVTRVVVIGAGDAGAGLVAQMLATPRGRLVPVAFLDDDEALHGLRVHGVQVVGSTDDLLETCRALAAHQVLVALPRAPRALLRSIADDAEAAGAATRVMPRLGDLVSGEVRLDDVRDLRIEDLLGRDPVATDLAAVGALVGARTVLVTGGGGSIGAEICRQVARLGLAMLVMLDRDETLLHDAEVDVGCRHEVVLADLRDTRRIKSVLTSIRPDVVFHAAAHKHVPILELHPSEAAETNVLGTHELVQICLATGVPRFIGISTDKAVHPSSIMGATKRLAEHVMTDAAQRSGAAYASVRFGNVLGSRGSVVPTFIRQIQAGGPVTVTSPRMTRYFMTIPEAVQLVLQAAALARGGEIFMLDMGEQVRIAELARRMIRLSGHQVGADVEIVFTGPRPGEKLAEELRRPEEVATPTDHPAVVRLQPVGPSAAQLAAGLGELRHLVATAQTERLGSTLMTYAHDVSAWPPESSEHLIDLTESSWNHSTT